MILWDLETHVLSRGADAGFTAVTSSLFYDRKKQTLKIDLNRKAKLLAFIHPHSHLKRGWGGDCAHEGDQCFSIHTIAAVCTAVSVHSPSKLAPQVHWLCSKSPFKSFVSRSWKPRKSKYTFSCTFMNIMSLFIINVSVGGWDGDAA